MVSTKSMVKEFADAVTDFIICTLSDFYFLSQEPEHILEVLIDNNFDGHASWFELYEGSGEDYRWNKIEGSDDLWLAKQQLDTMIQKMGVHNVCTTDFEKTLLKNGLQRIDFSKIRYNFLSDEEDSSSIDSEGTT